MKVFPTKKVCNVVLKSAKHEKITFPHEFIFCLSLITLRRYVKMDIELCEAIIGNIETNYAHCV